jgi:asparagine synthase (glutamine-hydrolysing)
MCGFAGFLDLRPNIPSATERQHILLNMGQALSRRGPDNEQRYDDMLSFVFRRLSIVDLETGQQPIWNEDHTLFIAINGEIYNHKELRAHLRQEHQFRTRSDAEVVLHLYEERGPKALDLLIGMFSIVIWDAQQRRLFLARDRMGVKPLFVYRTSSFLLFGSELKALLCHPDCPRELRWRDIEASFYQVHTRRELASYLEGIEQLPGGHYATYQDGQWRLHSYWSIDDHFEKDSGRSSSQYIDEYAALLEDSVQKRLMSDVPVGSFLSGGLDSAIIVSLASRSQKELHCFHALEKSVVRCGDTAAAQTLTSLLQVPLHSVLFDHRSLVDELRFDLSSFEYLIWLFDAPRFHLEWLLKHEMHRYAKTINPLMKVILLGQGADEFAGGYSRVYGLEANWENFEQDIKRALRQEAFDEQRISPALRDLLQEPYVSSLRSRTYSPFQEEMRRRVGVLQNFNLWHEDRSSAGHGMESRVPFLDHRLVELLASIPTPLHQELFWNKSIVRRAAQRWLPKELIERPKVGFFFTRDQSSILELALRLLQAVYPDFEEKYSHQSGSLFPQEKLRSLYTRSLQGGQGAQAAIEKLFGCMSIEVFRSLCQRPATMSSAPQTSFVSPSPLQEAKASIVELWSSLEDEELPEVTPEEKVSVEADIKVSRSLNGAPTLYFLRGDTLEQEIELGEDMEWIEAMLVKLQQSPCSLAELAEFLEVPEGDVQQGLRYLINFGLVCRVGSL